MKDQHQLSNCYSKIREEYKLNLGKINEKYSHKESFLSSIITSYGHSELKVGKGYFVQAYKINVNEKEINKHMNFLAGAFGAKQSEKPQYNKARNLKKTGRKYS